MRQTPEPVLRRRPLISPRTYALLCLAALVALMAIVFTGSAVRVTGSGLGCPTWPQCYEDGRLVAEADTHAWIEFGNRLITGVVGVLAVLPFAAARFRAPFRRDLQRWSALLPLGVLAQVVLGGVTVLTHLSPATVMGHFLLSMAIVSAAFVLWWRARREGPAPATPGDRRLAVGTRLMVGLGAVVIVAGTAATAAGPHAGGAGTGDEVERFYFRGPDTVDWLIQRHAWLGAALGLAAAGLWWLARRQDADRGLRGTLLRLAALMAAQGAVGPLQYALELPAELVWVHVVLATLLWAGLTRAWLEAGELEAGARPVRNERQDAARRLDAPGAGMSDRSSGWAARSGATRRPAPGETPPGAVGAAGGRGSAPGPPD